jgi:hypothetical protein
MSVPIASQVLVQRRAGTPASVILSDYPGHLSGGPVSATNGSTDPRLSGASSSLTPSREAE